MGYQITSGKTATGARILLYGVEGIGKTTLASQFPGAVFIDTEGSTKYFDVSKYPTPTSWSMLLDEIRDAFSNIEVLTLVIDSVDWAEKLCVQEVCSRAGKKGIEDFGYGAGYSFVTEEFGRFLNLLSEGAERGLYIVLVAHAAIRAFTNPEEMGQYNRYALELIDTPKCSNASMAKQWADAVLFANYKDLIVADDKTKRKYAQGGERVIYTQRTPAWDAKNRFNLPPEIPMTIEALAPILAPATGKTEATAPQKEPAPVKPTVQPQTTTAAATTGYQASPAKTTTRTIQEEIEWEGIPDRLADLMKANDVHPIEVRFAVAKNKHMPYDMPIKNYPPEYIDGVLVGAWSQVLNKIIANRTTEEFQKRLEEYQRADLASDAPTY